MPNKRVMWLLGLAAMPAWAAAPPEGMSQLRQDVLRADLTFLASEPMEGRLSLQRGSEIAVQWIAAEFAKAGLQPLGKGTYLQPVPLVEYRTDRTATKLTLTRQTKKEAVPAAVGSFYKDVTVQGPLVFAGYGISAPELKYDDYAGLDARGKVVLVLSHEPQERDAQSRFQGTGNTRYATLAPKLVNAQKHGAVGMILVTEPWARHHQGQPEPDLTRVRRPLPEMLPEGEVQIPYFTLPESGAAQWMEAAGKNLAALMAEMDRTGQPRSFSFSDTMAELRIVNAEARRARSYNVAGLLEGSDPSLKNETIIYSAHFDHDGMPAGAILPGADDNGSGTVGVVALARAFAANPVKPKRSILFVVFAAEERGLLGSHHYVTNPLRPLATTRAVINFDMIGRNEAHVDQSKGVVEIPADTSNEMNLVGASYSPDYRAAVDRANQQVGLRLNDKFDRDAAMNILFRSDQYPFLLHNIPAVWWFNGLHPDYHQTTDTVEKINFEKMTKILKLAYLTGWEFANSEVPRFRE